MAVMHQSVNTGRATDPLELPEASPAPSLGSEVEGAFLATRLDLRPKRFGASFDKGPIKQEGGWASRAPQRSSHDRARASIQVRLPPNYLAPPIGAGRDGRLFFWWCATRIHSSSRAEFLQRVSPAAMRIPGHDVVCMDHVPLGPAQSATSDGLEF